MDNLDYLKPSQRNRQKRRDKRLHEELIECRRYGGGDKNKKSRNRGEVRKAQTFKRSGTMPFRESYGAKRKGTHQDDNLEPLIRFLNSHVGEKWDEVYKKLSKQLDRRSATGLHVIEHLWDYVTRNVKVENGKYVFYNKYGSIPRWFGNIYFYVDPVTGVLLNAKHKNPKGPYPKKARWKKAKEKAKIKRKLGIVDKDKSNIYAYPQVATYDQKLEVGKLYDLEYWEDAKCYTIRFSLIEILVEETLNIRAKVIKSELKEYGTLITIMNNRLMDYQPYYYRRNHGDLQWKIHNVGMLEVKTKRREDT